MQPFPGTGDTSPRLRGVIGGPARSASFCDDQDGDEGDDDGDQDDEGDCDDDDGDDDDGANHDHDGPTKSAKMTMTVMRRILLGGK